MEIMQSRISSNNFLHHNFSQPNVNSMNSFKKTLRSSDKASLIKLSNTAKKYKSKSKLKRLTDLIL